MKRGAGNACPSSASAIEYGTSGIPAWRNVTTPLNASPPPTDLVQDMMAYDPLDNYTVLFGGESPSGRATNATWVFENGTWLELQPPVSPPAREAASLAWDPKDGYLVLFGGDTGGVTSCCVVNDTWSFVHGSWKEVSPGNLTPIPRAPPAREGASLAWDPVDDYLLLFGGSYLGTPTFNDTWAYVGGNWTELRPTQSPPIRTLASMVGDPSLPGVVLFGGAGNGSTLYADTWMWSQGSWTRLNVSGYSSGRLDVGAAYLPQLRAIVAYGGYSNRGPPHSDTWLFRGNWTNETFLGINPGPEGRQALAQGPGCGCLVMFGGYTGSGGYSFGTWEFYSLNLSATSSQSMGETPQNVTFSAYSSNDPIATVQWTFGDGATAAGVTVTHLYASAGDRTVLVNASDTWGAWTTAAIPVVVYPALDLIATATPLSGTAPLSVSAVSGAAGGDPPYSYAWSVDGARTSLASSTNLMFDVPGVHSVTVDVADQLGYAVNRTLSVTVVAAQSTAGLTATLTASRAVIRYDANFTFSAVAAGGSPPYIYTWPSLPPGCLSANVSTLLCLPQSAGVFPVSVEVNDSQHVSTSASTTVVVAGILNASLVGGAVSCVVPTEVIFSAAAAGGWGPYLSNWSWGDGTTESDVSLQNSHTYATAGTYHLIVTVSDSSGQTVNAGATIVVPDPLCAVSSTGTIATSVPWYEGTLGWALAGVAVGAVVGALVVVGIRRAGK